MHPSTIEEMLAIEIKKLPHIKMLTVFMNKLFESNVENVLYLNGSCAIFCNCKTLFNYIENKSCRCAYELSNASNEETKLLKIELNSFDNNSLMTSITKFINTQNDSQASLNNIRTLYMPSMDGKVKLVILMEHVSIPQKIRYCSLVPFHPVTLSQLLFRDALAHGTRQADIGQATKNTNTNAALQAIIRSHQTDFNQSKLSGFAAFEDLLAIIMLAVLPKADLEKIKNTVSTTMPNGRIMADGYFSKLTQLKKRYNRSKLVMDFVVKNKIEALTSYPIKFTHVAGILLSTPLPKRILVTASGALTSDTVIAGKRKKHFSQAFIGYLSPGYSEKYTANCSKSVSIAGALNAIKNYLRRRKEEYYLKKSASIKKRKALQIEHTSYTLTYNSDVLEKVGYGFYCF